ncbi:thioredoxin [Spizellomyces punctatus DAOM BR117]|uniref:Thioredoxin n=1 Tax=Spizellomyces punctatus (strain DAOM BR117) TaxID=645134 RepID=A0A0L0HDM2_SPIPD|nr:thioredoxin [Spizellomyces punctatus DAOM BR117]KNC98863.1 thioredoxin [Spizellomyces punctatus DAOM BR117]|eukprot:XP_016606903.1 thioredoxin [Spizellomyces punctatus DAOM BR117]
MGAFWGRINSRPPCSQPTSSSRIHNPNTYIMVKVVTTADEFNQIIKDNEIVIDFHATWCGPCKMIAPKFEEFSKKYSKAVFIKIDVDEVPEVAEKAGVSAMPTFHIYKNGQKEAEIVGANPAKLEGEISKYAHAQ